MAFTVNDYQDLVRLVEEHPDWQAELRRLLLADDFCACQLSCVSWLKRSSAPKRASKN